VTALTVKPTPADTDSVLLLHGAFTYPGYWWNHTELTAAVQAHPKVSADSLEAVHQAIADWNAARPRPRRALARVDRPDGLWLEQGERRRADPLGVRPRGDRCGFAWALQGVDPFPPTDPRVFCHD
jgi:hypothetical protein